MSFPKCEFEWEGNRISNFSKRMVDRHYLLSNWRWLYIALVIALNLETDEPRDRCYKWISFCTFLARGFLKLYWLNKGPIDGYRILQRMCSEAEQEDPSTLVYCSVLLRKGVIQLIELLGAAQQNTELSTPPICMWAAHMGYCRMYFIFRRDSANTINLFWMKWCEPLDSVHYGMCDNVLSTCCQMQYHDLGSILGLCLEKNS